MSNVGRVITDFYCGGLFGRDYDHADAVIEAEGDDWIVIRKKNGLLAFGSFQAFDWERDEHQYPVRPINIQTRSNKQEMIDLWCSDF